MAKEMLINTFRGQECRIAIVSDGRLEELYMERASSASRVGNIYKARVTNVESAIQAAFIDFGGIKNGFLHVSDLHPQYFPKGKSAAEPVGRKCPQRHRPPIQKCLRRGQEIVVQMTKEGIGTKGPTMTTYLSIPGRLLVMMPGMSQVGVSRKIEEEKDRAKARKMLAELDLPKNIGFILRTAGVSTSKRELRRDLNYLTRLWRATEQRISKARAPAEIYRESDLVVRTIRDVYSSQIDRILCDHIDDARKVKEFLDMAAPRTRYCIEVYTGDGGLFHDYGLEQEIERIHARRVELSSGGSLVIDQTEALVAIDVNSGKFRDHSDAEKTALNINKEAAAEIARQLRLRDLGGVIVIDFIDMWQDRNRRAVEKAFRDAIKPDRAKTKVLRISPLGLVEMTRQRVRPSLKASVYRHCPHCQGAGMIKSEESVALLVMRDLTRALSLDDVTRVEVRVTPSVAYHLANVHRKGIAAIEEQTRKRVLVHPDRDLTGNEFRFECFNQRNSPVTWPPETAAAATKLPAKVQTVPVEEALRQRSQAPRPPQPAQGGPQAPADQAASPAAEGQAPAKKKRRRGRRGGKRHKKKSAAEKAVEAAAPAEPAEPGLFDTPPPDEQVPPPSTGAEQPQAAATDGAAERPQAEAAEGQAPPRKKRRRGRRGGRRHRRKTSAAQAANNPPASDAPADNKDAPANSGNAPSEASDTGNAPAEAGDAPAEAGDAPNAAPGSSSAPPGDTNDPGEEVT